VLLYFVNYVVVSQIPWTFNQCGYSVQSAIPHLCPFKARSVSLAAFSGKSDFSQLQTKLLDLRVLRFFVKYVLLSQIPWRTLNQCGYPGQSAYRQLCPFKERSVKLAACSGSIDFTQLQTKNDSIWGCGVFLLYTFVTNTLKKVQPMQVPGPIRRSSVMPV